MTFLFSLVSLQPCNLKYFIANIINCTTKSNLYIRAGTFYLYENKWKCLYIVRLVIYITAKIQKVEKDHNLHIWSYRCAIIV